MLKPAPSPVAPQQSQTVDQRILNMFRSRSSGELVSGEELSEALGVSRTAVWKHVKSLKNLGYKIVSVPSRGYRFLGSPDSLTPMELSSGFAGHRIGGNILCVPETESTNTMAFRLAEQGADEGTVVIAEEQSGGKGRLGRKWASPPGVNLYCSVILRPAIVPVDAFQLTFLSAVAVARTLEKVSHLQSRIKWPNDVLVGMNKIAGLLNEMSAETEKVNFIILGIGCNLNMKPEQFPPDLRQPATSVFMETGHPVNRVTWTQKLLQELDTLYGAYLSSGFGPVREEWLERSHMQGQRVSVTNHGQVTTGLVAGIEDNGALLLRLDTGSIEKIYSGDVKLVG